MLKLTSTPIPLLEWNFVIKVFGFTMWLINLDLCLCSFLPSSPVKACRLRQQLLTQDFKRRNITGLSGLGAEPMSKDFSCLLPISTACGFLFTRLKFALMSPTSSTPLKFTCKYFPPVALSSLRHLLS